MTEPFDPYRKWLGIPPKDQPPNHYRLLGIATFESDPDVIENAASRQMAHVRTFKTSKHAALSQRVLTELSAAKVCLLVPAEKVEYDQQLRARLTAEGRLSSEEPLEGDAAGDEGPPAPPEPPPFPGVSRGGSRWKTEGSSDPPPIPPPVPIAMPVGTAVAPVPAFRGRSAASYKPRRKQSALPVAIIAVSLLILVGGGVVAAIVFNQPSEPVTRQKSKPQPPPEKPAARQPPSKPEPIVSRPPPQSRRPVEDPNRLPGALFPLGRPDPSLPSPTPMPTPISQPSPSGSDSPPIDRLRQQLFQARQALAQRDDTKFVADIELAEAILTEPKLDQSLRGQLREEIEHLLNLQKLCDQFWTTVRENLQTKVAAGEVLQFFKAKVELISFNEDVVTLKFNDGEAKQSPLREIDPVAAALIAAKSANIGDPATFLPILAFLAVDERAEKTHGEDNVVKFSRRFFNENKLAGPRNLRNRRPLRAEAGRIVD